MANAMVKTFSDKASEFSAVGDELALEFCTGITKKKDIIANAFETVASNAAVLDETTKTAFYNAGSSVVTGFANGISDNTYKAEAKAKAMAEAAEQEARDALDINSPSKVFRRIGMGVPEGFAQGIGKLGNKVKRSVVGMSNVALDNTKVAIAQLASSMDSDIDTQPTIRPVLDLSDVRSGASNIDDIFSAQPMVGTISNARAISTMMNRGNQNGTNNDVISAINDLKKTIGNASGDTYHINGITYDDRSNVADAVQTLVRAARVERRI